MSSINPRPQACFQADELAGINEELQEVSTFLLL